MIICLTGLAGSGKSTVARKYIEYYSPASIYLEAGAVARAMAETDEETREALAAGKIAPPERMDEAMRLAMSKAYLDATNAGSHVLLDGYPRYTRQVDTLLELFDESNLIVVRLSCTEHVARNRLIARGRADDTPNAIMARHKFYWESTVIAIDSLMRRTRNRVVIPCFGTTDETVDTFNREISLITK